MPVRRGHLQLQQHPYVHTITHPPRMNFAADFLDRKKKAEPTRLPTDLDDILPRMAATFRWVRLPGFEGNRLLNLSRGGLEPQSRFEDKIDSNSE